MEGEEQKGEARLHRPLHGEALNEPITGVASVVQAPSGRVPNDSEPNTSCVVPLCAARGRFQLHPSCWETPPTLSYEGRVRHTGCTPTILKGRGQTWGRRKSIIWRPQNPRLGLYFHHSVAV